MKNLAKTLVILLCSGLFVEPASGQILNIEKRRLEQEGDDYFVGNVGTNFSYNNRSPTLREPVRVLSMGLNSHLGYFHGSTAYLLVSDYQLLNINGDIVVNNGTSHLRMQLFRKKRLHFEVYNQYQYDVQRGLRARGLVGANARFLVYQSKRLSFTAGAGPMYEVERWDHPFEEGRRVSVQFLKLSSYFSTRFVINETLDFNGIVYYQVGRDGQREIFRHRISSDLNLSATVSELFSLTSSLTLTYETAPIVPIIPLVFATSHGVRVNF